MGEKCEPEVTSKNTGGVVETSGKRDMNEVNMSKTEKLAKIFGGSDKLKRSNERKEKLKNEEKDRKMRSTVGNRIRDIEDREKPS